MKTAGIIAEYNPFHCGHQFHIEETRRRTGADFLIVVMSGSFVQRGAPALLNKYDRARMALLHGADLVFELPVTAALSSAEGFATGGIALLAGLGVVDCVSCGSESAGEDPALFSRVASLLAGETPEYREQLRAGLKNGLSYPAARERAVRMCLPDDGKTGSSALDPSPDALKRLLSGPNNILALEYARAIHTCGAAMDLVLIPRQGESHHGSTLTGLTVPGSVENYPSSTAIRNSLLGVPTEGSDDALRSAVPPDVFEFLLQAGKEHGFLSENDFSALLSYALTRNRGHLREFGPENPDLAGRTENILERFSDWTGFADFLKTKNQTYTAVSRYLAQILLDIRREDLVLASKYHYAPYARLLGFRAQAAPLMKSIQERADIPLLTHPAKDAAALPEAKRRMLDLDISASDIYLQVQKQHSGCERKPELRQPLVTVD